MDNRSYRKKYWSQEKKISAAKNFYKTFLEPKVLRKKILGRRFPPKILKKLLLKGAKFFFPKFWGQNPIRENLEKSKKSKNIFNTIFGRCEFFEILQYPVIRNWRRRTLILVKLFFFQVKPPKLLNEDPKTKCHAMSGTRKPGKRACLRSLSSVQGRRVSKQICQNIRIVLYHIYIT